MKIIDQKIWKRKEHFDFFSKFTEPFFGIVSEIDMTRAVQVVKEKKISLFAYYLHKSLIAVNGIEELKLRVDKNNVIQYDEIHASATLGRDDNTFGFSFVPYNIDFNTFNDSLKSEINHVRNTEGLNLNENGMRKDVVHYSSLPWSRFTGLTHARNFNSEDSATKIVFGKIFEKDNKKVMSVSLNMHHGLTDGWHASKHLELFQNLLNE